MTKFVIEVANTPYFNPKDEVSIVVFTRGPHGPELVTALDECINEGVYLSGDFQVAEVVAQAEIEVEA